MTQANSSGDVYSKSFTGALADEDGNVRHFINGAYGREGDLPAVECADGTQCWYKENPKRGGMGQQWAILHREQGPAVTRLDGRNTYYVNGHLHREDGPAHVTPEGVQKWFLENEFVKAVFPDGRVVHAPPSKRRAGVVKAGANESF